MVAIAHELKRLLSDYIDRVIVATATAAGEDLVTEDSKIHGAGREIVEAYGVHVYRYRDLVEGHE